MKKIDLQNINIEDIKKREGSLFNFKENAKRYWKIYKQRSDSQNQEFKEKLAQYSPLTKYVTVMYVILFCAGFFSYFYTIPSLKENITIRGNIIAQTQNIKSLKSDLNTLEAMSSSVAQLHNTIKQVKKIAPEEAHEEDIILTIEKLLSKNGIAPPKQFSWAQEKNMNINTPQLRQNFQIYSYTFFSDGTKKQIFDFMSDLRKNMRILDIKSFKTTPKDASSEGEPILKFSISLWAYNLYPDEI
ncbi:hypothetical protein COB57_03475 [Candidatus Peregrinibacteria bacterium]|nr:MAG: hypothetical protein COB57_03475 [Candidatus Peregrinibacteria bacterium]